MLFRLLTLGVGVIAVACSGSDGEVAPAVTPTPFPTVSAASGVASPPAPLIDSPVFSDGSSIPTRHTCDGENLSPELTWSAGAGGARSIAMLVDDPDAPGRTFNHWLVFNMPPDSIGLAEGAAPGVPGVTGINDFGARSYRGPCPPPGSPHRYRFTVYYLDTMLALGDGAKRDDFLEAAEGHVLQQVTLTGLYGR